MDVEIRRISPKRLWMKRFSILIKAWCKPAKELLIYCNQGMNRSPGIALIGRSKAEDHTFWEVIWELWWLSPASGLPVCRWP